MRLAVFADYENVALGAREAGLDASRIQPVLERLLELGTVVSRRAYCDWTRYRSDRRPLHEAGFELIEVPHLSYSGKNSGDIRMAVVEAAIEQGLVNARRDEASGGYLVTAA